MTGPDAVLTYIHIGKCGGMSLFKALQHSAVIQRKFRHIERVHIARPSCRPDAVYLIVLRNPVSRALSAFNWRYRLVVGEGRQRDRFVGEYDILTRYGTLNALAENLYRQGQLDEDVAGAFRAIHHLREDIGFYLTDLLDTLRADQIYAVLLQEFLDEDMATVLGTTNPERIHHNRPDTPDERLHLSDLARENLARFLAPDYAAIRRLNALNPLEPRKLEVVLA